MAMVGTWEEKGGCTHHQSIHPKNLSKQRKTEITGRLLRLYQGALNISSAGITEQTRIYEDRQKDKALSRLCRT